MPVLCLGDMASSGGAQWMPFEDGPLTIEERFVSQGRKRQDEVWKIYVQQDSVQAPLFDSEGRPYS